ncbi:MAG: class II aldolase/adducin family protein [Chloroflexi bacterium]|nr:class II aldolase/adducin family protein [Chloroflexota bacterium]MCY3582169.1 class II aldolase/adducin family protein [Chloroflexota bacterium]MCY3715162.1 class II aldolase/adducin family protein [Chloroflexota bacterium]MDE2649933.1 class II aldolase/adducin family protein [Chloroflexota bacterium]MYA93486.1 class II aldolase [Chloroflexota bacterium]
MSSSLASLIQLSRALGDPARDYVIIGEGNTSLRCDAESFLVKASGHQLHEISAEGFVRLRMEPILSLLDDPPATLSEEKARTQAAALDGRAGVKASVEASFHAMLLHECGARYIGHTHPTAVNKLLCSEYAADFARQRRFPDEVVLCGPQSALVPYADPGLPLALEMRKAVRDYQAQQGEAPKLILLVNHGLVALGQSPSEVLNITAMAVKAARIYHGALLTDKPTHLPEAAVWHIYRRPDEIYRRQRFVKS